MLKHSELTRNPMGGAETGILSMPLLAFARAIVAMAEQMEGVPPAAVEKESPPALVTKAELARALGASESHVDRLRKAGLPTHFLGQNSPRFDVEECRAWLAERSKQRTVRKAAPVPVVEDDLGTVRRLSKRAVNQ